MCRRSYFLPALLFLLLSLQQIAQTRIEDLMKLKPATVASLKTTEKPNSVALQMDFNSPTILNPKDAEVLKGKSILRVELYYTVFQLAESFSQPALNEERYKALKKLCPDLFKQTFAEWKSIGQNGCRNVAEAKKYFHGFVITYIPTPDEESIKKEEKLITELLHNDSLGHDTEYVTVTYKYRKLRKKSGLYMPILKSKRDKGIRYAHKGIWPRKKEYVVKIDTLAYKHKGKDFVPSKHSLTFMRRLPDSTIFKVLERHAKWNNILFVCDVTGSMSPYSAEILLWHKLNYKSNRARYFTFFNDGDNMADHKKKLGRTGGVYNVAAGNYEAVEISLFKTMEKGGGGDAPENNCEAILKAMQQVGDVDEIVMIADNWANIKDLELAKKINKPVRIILCAAENGYINVDYLELAKQTGGSIHIMDEDLEELMKLNEGAVFTFGKSQFKIVKGKITPYNPI